MDEKIVISRVGEIYELEVLVKTFEGSGYNDTVELERDCENLDEAIKNTLDSYYETMGALLYRKYVFKDEFGNEYFSTPEFVKEIE